MNEFGIFHDFHGLQNLRYNESWKVEWKPLEHIFFQQVINWSGKELKNNAEVIPEDEKVEHSDQRALTTWVIDSIQLKELDDLDDYSYDIKDLDFNNPLVFEGLFIFDHFNGGHLFGLFTLTSHNLSKSSFPEHIQDLIPISLKL